MKKAIYINEQCQPELITYSKLSEIIDNYNKTKISNNFTVYESEDENNSIIINDKSLFLPILITSKQIMNTYDWEMLIETIEDSDNDEILIDDDFLSENDEEEDEVYYGYLND